MFMSINTIKRFVYVVETDFVLCEVRIDFLYIISINFSLQNSVLFWTVLRPAISTQISSVILCFEENAAVFPDFKFAIAMLFTQRSKI
jgi:hypothetical protein